MSPRSRRDRIRDVVVAAGRLGLGVTDPRVLADGGNLLVHLAPWPLVARVTTLFGEDGAAYWREVLVRELAVARHLDQAGVPVAAPATEIDPGPHPVAETWMTLWTYVPPVRRPTPRPELAADLLIRLSTALSSYPGTLPWLGPWKNASDWARRLEPAGDVRTLFLLEAWHEMDRWLGSLSPGDLVPVHGDAHIGNLHPGPEGWIWIDFEDVGYMPRYWDLASFVARSWLLGEGRTFSERVVAGVLGTDPSEEERRCFARALAARAVLSTVVSTALARQGQGDPKRAERRLERLPELLGQLSGTW